MRNSDLRFSSSGETPNNMRYPIQYIPFHNQNQNIYYQTPIALHLSPSQITNGSHLNSNVLYQSVFPIGHQQLMLNTNPHLVISVPCPPSNISDNNNLSNQSSIDSHLSTSVTSPTNILSNQNIINYSLSKWNEIASLYDGNDDIRPSAGQLRNGKYFTQRSAGKDIYMVFNSKADYINNFVNYYFSNKNLSTDEKLFNLMDDNGSVALGDLVKFPRLAQIGTTIDNIVEALKYSQFVVIVNLQNDGQGIRRSDGWFPSKLLDESQQSSNSQWSTVTTGSSGDGGGVSASLHKPNPEQSSYRSPNVSANTVAPNNNHTTSSHQPLNIDLSGPTGVTSIQSQHQTNNNDMHTQMDTPVGTNNNNINNNSSLIYFTGGSTPGGGLHQQYTPTAFVHGIHHQGAFTNIHAPPPTQSQAAPPSLQSQNPSQILSATSAHVPQLIISAQPHYQSQHPPTQTFFHANPVPASSVSMQQRPLVWQGLSLTDLTRSNHMLYSSSNTANNNNNHNNNNTAIRHVIGAGGNNQTNFKQCQY